MVDQFNPEIKVSLSNCNHCVVFEIRKVQPQVIVATPGRLIDLIENLILDLSNCKYQILDEGDKMFDLGFEDDIKTIQYTMPEA